MERDVYSHGMLVRGCCGVASAEIYRAHDVVSASLCGQVVLYADYTIATHKLDPTPGNSLPFTAKPGKRRPMVSSRLLCPVSASGNSSGLSSSCFGVVWWTPKKPTISDCVFVSVGYVDGSLRWQSLDGKKHGVGVGEALPRCAYLTTNPFRWPSRRPPPPTPPHPHNHPHTHFQLCVCLFFVPSLPPAPPPLPPLLTCCQVLMACSQRVAPVVSLSVGSDGKTLLTGHSDCTAHLWQVRSRLRGPYILACCAVCVGILYL
jgi:hypothetical protein